MPFAEPGILPKFPPDRTVRIVHAVVQLSVDPERQAFSGVATLELEAYPTFAGIFAFDFDEVTLIDVTDGNGAPMTFRFADGALEVRSEAVPSKLVVRWKGERPRRGLYFTGPTASEPARPYTAWTQCQDEDGHFVFPCHDHPSVKHPWTLEIEAPADYTVLSNGQPAEQGVRPDGRVWARFEQREPMPAYLVTFVAAPLDVVEADWRGKPVRYFVPKGRAPEVDRAFGRTPQMLEHFSTLLGVDYPWPRYDQVVVHDFIFGGMENVACTTMTDLLLVDEKAAVGYAPDGLVAHELAHQWFGDLVTCEDWSQAWLNESWATFMEAVWWEHHDTAQEATWYRYSTAKGYHNEVARRYRRAIVSHTYREPIDLFDGHLYNKGSCVLWTLRAELGGAVFWKGVRAYLRGHGNDTVHTRHFQRAIERATGTNLEQFFRQWVFAPGHPILEVGLSRDGDKGVVLKVAQTQTGEDVPEAYGLVLRVEIVSADGVSQRHELRLSERKHVFVLPAPAGGVGHVRIDPDYRILAEITLSGPEAWLLPLLADPCPVLALRAGRALLKDGSPKGLAAVESAVTGHPFRGVRGALAGELAKVGTDGALAVLVSALANEPEARAAADVATALGAFRKSASADALIERLSAPMASWQLHGAVLVALGKTRDPRAVDVLTSHLSTASWADHVCQRALEGLAETEDECVVDALIAHTDPECADRTRQAAAVGLGRIGDAVPVVMKRALDRLVQMLVEPGFRAQLGAISALARLRDPASAAPLSRLHAAAPDGRTKRAAYEALARVRAGRTTAAGLSAMHRRIEALGEENAQLRERIQRLER